MAAMKKLRYGVAMSLDGFIADEHDGYDWIVHDDAIDFKAIWNQFDTLVMGRRTFEVTLAQNGGGKKGFTVVVCSTTLKQDDHPKVTIVNDRVIDRVAALKEEAGKDIWLFGGGNLFRTLYDAGLVDMIEIALIPVMLGSGIPVIAPGVHTKTLRLLDSKTLPSGIVMLTYAAPQVTGVTAG
jgi:dihydrofolate reductase